MVAYTFYESDNRVRRYAETLAREGWHVDAIALRKPGQVKRDCIKGVRVFRIQARTIDEKSKWNYLWRLLKFFFASSFWLAILHGRHKYAVIHVHSVPDFEVFAAWIPRLLGARVILDIHDIVPEFFADKFNAPMDSAMVRLLLFTEKICCSFAHHVIISNDLWRKRLTERSVKPEKCTCILNYPRAEIFRRREQPPDWGKRLVMLYPGTLAEHQGLDVAIRACSILRKDLPGFEFHIIGNKGPLKKELRQLVTRLGLNKCVRFFDPVTTEEVAVRMANVHIGIVPKLARGFGNEAFSTKILEFMSVGVPVIASDTAVDRFYFNDGSVLFFRSGDSDDLVKKVLDLLNDAHARTKQLETAARKAHSLAWEYHKNDYFRVIEIICGFAEKGGNDHQ